MKEKIFKILIIVLIIIQPIIDLIKSLYGSGYEICGISVVELINTMIIALILLFSLKKIMKDKKIRTVFLILMCIYAVYSVFHIQNIKNYNINNIFEFKDNNYFKELYYIARVYIQPLVLLFCLWSQKISANFILRYFKWAIYIITLVIVVSNILNVSLVAYSVENTLIKGNIFNWFTYKGSSFDYITSKGLFFSANQLSIILLITLAIVINNIYKEHKKSDYLLLLLNLISLLMLGTTTSTIGSAILISFYSIYILIYDRKIIKSKYTIAFLVILLVYSLVFVKSPFMLKYMYNIKKDYSDPESQIIIKQLKEEKNQYSDLVIDYNNIINTIDCNNYDELEKNQMIKYMNKTYYFHKINYFFIENYPVENDFEFWCGVYKRDKSENNDNRKMKTELFNRIFELNNNKSDKYFGITHILGFIDLERGYTQQYYEFGIIGVILLLGPYIFISILSMIEILKRIKEKFELEKIIFPFTLAFCLTLAYFVGHVFNNLFVSIYLSILAYIVLYNIKGWKK